MGSRTSLSKPGDVARITGTVVRRLVGAFEVETKEELANDIINDEFGETEHMPRAVQMPSEKGAHFSGVRRRAGHPDPPPLLPQADGPLAAFRSA